jgi:hypothetical protein
VLSENISVAERIGGGDEGGMWGGMWGAIW